MQSCRVVEIIVVHAVEVAAECGDLALLVGVVALGEGGVAGACPAAAYRVGGVRVERVVLLVVLPAGELVLDVAGGGLVGLGDVGKVGIVHVGQDAGTFRGDLLRVDGLLGQGCVDVGCAVDVGGALGGLRAVFDATVGDLPVQCGEAFLGHVAGHCLLGNVHRGGVVEAVAPFVDDGVALGVEFVVVEGAELAALLGRGELVADVAGVGLTAGDLGGVVLRGEALAFRGLVHVVGDPLTGLRHALTDGRGCLFPVGSVDAAGLEGGAGFGFTPVGCVELGGAVVGLLADAGAGVVHEGGNLGAGGVPGVGVLATHFEDGAGFCFAAVHLRVRCGCLGIRGLGIRGLGIRGTVLVLLWG